MKGREERLEDTVKLNAELIDKGGPDEEKPIHAKRGRAISPEKGGPDQEVKPANKAMEVKTK